MSDVGASPGGLPAHVPQGHAGPVRRRGPSRDVGAPSNTTRENVGYEMTHELGHGIVEKALEGDGSVLKRFATAVGWSGRSALRHRPA